MNELKLKDIKPIVDINDSSLYILIALVAAILIVTAIVGFFIYQKRAVAQRRYKKSEIYKAKEALKNLDFSDTKGAVYNFSKYAHILVKDEQKEQLNRVLQSLEQYKFKKDIPNLSSQDKEAMKKFIKEVV